jgi:hypothetical protein
VAMYFAGAWHSKQGRVLFFISMGSSFPGLEVL